MYLTRSVTWGARKSLFGPPDINGTIWNIVRLAVLLLQVIDNWTLTTNGSNVTKLEQSVHIKFRSSDTTVCRKKEITINELYV